MSLPALAQTLRMGELSVADYLTHLEAQFRARESSVLAFVPEENRFERLRRETNELVTRHPTPDTRPPLFGVSVGVKDIFHVTGFTTHAGSNLPPEVLQGVEAECVTALKNAGALILGKTVTTEFAYFGPGPTRNPHNPEHTPGGSSSGSAAAVAAGLAPLTLGTQTIGSVVRPASFCGVVGFKPTSERISRAGVIPLSPSFDHIGMFAADVAGVALAASVLCQDWKAESKDSQKPILGIPDGPYLARASDEMLAHFRALCQRLATAGYTFKTVPVMPDFADIRERHYLITAADAYRVHAQADWFPRFREVYHPKTLELLERGQSVSEGQLTQALGDREKLCDELKRAMDEYTIDLWLAPSAPGPAPRGLDSTGDPLMNLPWSQVGFPALNLPSGRDAEGLPLGLQLVGRWNKDEVLLGWAAEVERVIGNS